VNRIVRISIGLFALVSLAIHSIRIVNREYYYFNEDVIILSPRNYDILFEVLLSILFIFNILILVYWKPNYKWLIILWIGINVFSLVYTAVYPRMFPFMPY